MCSRVGFQYAFVTLPRIQRLYHDGQTNRIQWPIYTLENIGQFCIFQH